MKNTIWLKFKKKKKPLIQKRKGNKKLWFDYKRKRKKGTRTTLSTLTQWREGRFGILSLTTLLLKSPQIREKWFWRSQGKNTKALPKFGQFSTPTKDTKKLFFFFHIFSPLFSILLFFTQPNAPLNWKPMSFIPWDLMRKSV